jgi:hypothetical protein
MGVMMDEREDRFDEFLRQAAQDYNAPPETPRAKMWERVQAERRKGGKADGATADVLPFRPSARPTARPLFRVALGIAAVLAIGVAIGRYTAVLPVSPVAPAPGPASAVAAAPDRSDRRDVASQIATAEHLTRVETFLTEFGTPNPPAGFSSEAHDLLGTTRLLIDSKRVTDLRTRQLLEDLELVLTQIATLDPKDHREDLDLIADGLAQSHLRTRLRNAIPAGPVTRM